MVHWASFFRTYKKSLIILITPVLLLPLLFQNELTTMTNEDLCKLYQDIFKETCDDTIQRLATPGNEPVMYKVSLIFDGRQPL
jgi:hypothetical protein